MCRYPLFPIYYFYCTILRLCVSTSGLPHANNICMMYIPGRRYAVNLAYIKYKLWLIWLFIKICLY